MSNRSRVLSVLLLLFAFTAIAYADQPLMRAARTDLQQAKAQLQAATANKGGHRVKAIEYINAAIAEVKAGVRFDRRNNHASTLLSEVFNFTSADQPHMQRALDHLRQAKSNLEAATADKGGHRVKAIDYVNKATDEVKKGIEAGE